MNATRIYFEDTFRSGREDMHRPVSESYLLHTAYRSTPDRGVPSPLKDAPSSRPPYNLRGERKKLSRLRSSNFRIERGTLGHVNARARAPCDTACVRGSEFKFRRYPRSLKCHFHTGSPPREPRLVKFYRPLPRRSRRFLSSGLAKGTSPSRNKFINNRGPRTPH